MSALPRRKLWSLPVWRCISLAERPRRTKVCSYPARCPGPGLWWWSPGGPWRVWRPPVPRTSRTRCSSHSHRNIHSLLGLLETTATTGEKTWRYWDHWRWSINIVSVPLYLYLYTWQYAFDVVKASNWQRYFRIKINIIASSELYPTTPHHTSSLIFHEKKITRSD